MQLFWILVRYNVSLVLLFLLLKLCFLQKIIYRISSNKRPQRLSNFEILKYGAYYREALISKLGEMNNNKCQKLVIFSFKIRMKRSSSLSINQIQWKNLIINNIVIALLFAH